MVSSAIDVAVRIALNEGLEECEKPLDAIANAGRVLGIAMSRAFGHSRTRVAISDSFQVKPRSRLSILLRDA